MQIIDDLEQLNEASDEERHKVLISCPKCELNRAMDPYRVCKYEERFSVLTTSPCPMAARGLFCPFRCCLQTMTTMSHSPAASRRYDYFSVPDLIFFNQAKYLWRLVLLARVGGCLAL